MLTSITNPRSLVLALALGCFLSGAASAHGETPQAPPTHSPASKSSSQQSANGKPHSRRLAKVSRANGSRGWTAYCFFPKYHCYGYYSSVKGLWFYWYAPFNRYLPTSYLAIYPPPNVGIVPTIAGTAPANLAFVDQPPLPGDAAPAPADQASVDQPPLPPGAAPAPMQPASDSPISSNAKHTHQRQPTPKDE